MNRKEWLVAIIIIFITICVWVISDILHTRAKVGTPQAIQEILEPINPDFDTAVLETP